VCSDERESPYTGADAQTPDGNQQQWVKKAGNPLPKFYSLQYKETYQDARKEFVNIEHVTNVSRREEEGQSSKTAQ